MQVLVYGSTKMYKSYGDSSCFYPSPRPGLSEFSPSRTTLSSTPLRTRLPLWLMKSSAVFQQSFRAITAAQENIRAAPGITILQHQKTRKFNHQCRAALGRQPRRSTRATGRKQLHQNSTQESPVQNSLLAACNKGVTISPHSVPKTSHPKLTQKKGEKERPGTTARAFGE